MIIVFICYGSICLLVIFVVEALTVCLGVVGRCSGEALGS